VRRNEVSSFCFAPFSSLSHLAASNPMHPALSIAFVFPLPRNDYRRCRVSILLLRGIAAAVRL
jgi:hypothetical protein